MYLLLGKRKHNMRIAILGYSGAGKSTLAAALGRKCCLPVLHLDCVHFKKNWQERPDELALQILKPYMKQENWIIDGNYGSLAIRDRLELADVVIILKLSRFRCLLRALKRYKMYRGNTRPSMAPGCEEKMDRDFLRWVLFQGRKQNRPRYSKICKAHREKVIVCRTPGSVRRLLRNTDEILSRIQS